jgi:hypothetical protein
VVAVADRLVEGVQLGRAALDRRVHGVDEADHQLLVHLSSLRPCSQPRLAEAKDKRASRSTGSDRDRATTRPYRTDALWRPWVHGAEEQAVRAWLLLWLSWMIGAAAPPAPPPGLDR